MQLIQDDEFAFHSPRWGMAPMTAANDKLQRARPVQILSAGLTNTPFIPGSLAVANDDMAVAQEAATSIDVPTLATLLGLEPASPLSKVLAEIARLFEIATQLAKGSRLVNEAEWRASETAAGQLVQANTELAAARAAAETEKALALAATARVQELEGRIVAANDQLTGAQTAATETAARIEAANTATVQAREEAARTAAALEAANTALVASRKAHAGLIVATAIEEGRMFQADRDARIAELVAANCDAAACDRIANAPVIVKVRSEIGNLGGRRIGAAVSASLLERARQQAEQTGGDVTEIYIRLKGAA